MSPGIFLKIILTVQVCSKLHFHQTSLLWYGLVYMCLTVIFTGEHSSVLDVWSGYWFARQRCPLEIRALCSKCAALKCANRSMQFGAQLIFQYKDSTYGLYLIFFFCNSIARGQRSPVSMCTGEPVLTWQWKLCRCRFRYICLHWCVIPLKYCASTVTSMYFKTAYRQEALNNQPGSPFCRYWFAVYCTSLPRMSILRCQDVLKTKQCRCRTRTKTKPDCSEWCE